jgi:pimeloyl-ACP methyl ester carboxylesterase
VLVHGLPGSAYDWDPLPSRLLAAGLRVIRYDRVGYGHSDARRSNDEHSIDRNSSELVQLLARLSLESPIVVGWSYGGGVALRAAEDAPSRVGGLVLLGSIGPASHLGGSHAVAQVLQWPRRWAVASGFPARIGVALFGPFAFGGTPPDGWREHALAALGAPGAVRTWTMEAAGADASVLHPERVAVPVTILHGTEDQLSPYTHAVDLHRRLQASQLVEVLGGSHMLPNTHAPLVVEHVHRLAARDSGGRITRLQ